MRALRSTPVPVNPDACWRAGAIGALAVIALTIVALAPLLFGGTLVGQDTAAFFAPMYALLGDRLRAGELPVWNPYQFLGAPLLADPESGWLYWPAMILFALLPIASAVRAYLVVHLLLAGLATYLFGRLLGLSVAGAVTAAGAYELSGLVYGRSVCCPAYIQVAAWLPVTLLATELTIRARSWLPRLGWCWLAAFALSQIFASWLGQGSYYVLLVIGGYVLFRAVAALTPPPPLPGGGEGESDPSPSVGRGVARSAVVRVFAVGVMIVALGVLLAAAAILPRFEFRATSTLAGGYEGDLAWAARQGGWGLGDFANRLFAPGLTFTGGATAVLSLTAIGVTRRRFAVPFFAAMIAGVLLLTTTWENPVQRLLFLVLPEFEGLHQHWPERAMVVFALAPAMLAGAAVTTLPTLRRLRLRWLIPLTFAPLALLVARLFGSEFHALAIGGTAAVALLIALTARFSRLSHRRLLAGALGTVLVAELFAAGMLAMRDGPYGGFHRLDLQEYFSLDGAGAFIAAQEAEAARDRRTPFRFFGYNPVYREIENEHGQVTYYRYHFAEQGTRVLLVNNLGTRFGLSDIQGYNPLQMQHYVDFMGVLNGTSQEYHGSWVLPTGIDSPLIDLLGVRYVIVPAVAPPGRPEIARLARTWPVVYRDAEVIVLENLAAFPRAWLAHDAVTGNVDTLARGVAESSLDLRTTAITNSPVNGRTPAPNPSAESVTVTEFSPESMTVQVTAGAPALLVTSEVDYPAWQAYVDGEPVDIVRVNVAFRGVPVPAGEHTVEFRYESTALTAGLLLSGAAYVAAMSTAGAIAVQRIRRRRTDR